MRLSSVYGLHGDDAKQEETLEKKRGAAKPGLRKRLGSLPFTLTILYLIGGQVSAFTAYDCSNKSNVIESYSLLEPYACASSDKAGEVETTVYGEILQMKQDRMIPVFRCQVFKTIVLQYCGDFSAAGVTRYIHFREPKALEASECRQARSLGKVVIGGRTVQAKIGATISHVMFLSGAMDDDSNCETGIISFPNGKTLEDRWLKGCTKLH
jgi:hypothetical protein